MPILRIIDIVFPLFAIAATGAFYAWRFRPDMSIPNTININVFLPALVFAALVNTDADLSSFHALIIGALFVVLGSGVLGLILSRCCGFSAKTFVPPIMFCNSGNMGVPLLTFTFGPVALPVVTVLFLVENFLHFTLGSYLLNKQGNPLKNLLSPIIVATAIALTVNGLDLTVHQTVMQPINMLGQAAVPVMLFSLGTRLIDADFSEWKIGLVAAIAAPLIGIALALAILPFLDLTPLQTGSLILFGALPPAVLNYLFAERYNQEPAKVASIVVISHLFTLVSLPLVLAFVLAEFA